MEGVGAWGDEERLSDRNAEKTWEKKLTERVEERGVNGMKGVWIVRCTDRCNNRGFGICHLRTV